MIKRMNKVTSLLVAAAAIVSLVPATGVSAAERLGTKEGTIEKAYAFDGGKYIYEGYKTEDDESGVYFNSGDKDKLVEDIDALNGTYGTKYAEVGEGSDEYLLDLSNGKVLDEEKSDMHDTLNTKLRSTLRKTDRYKDAKTGEFYVSDEEIPSNNFADSWFEYKATTGTAVAYGFTNQSAKYIDASFLANMTVVVDNDTTVKVDKFGKAKEYGDNKEVTVNLESIEAIGQDKNSIYTKTVVTTNGAADVKLTYIQKLSKAQGEKEDGAYLPKKVESFLVSDMFSEEEDIVDAKTALEAHDYEVKVINGVLYVTDVTSGKATVTTIKLKKAKVATTANAKKLDVYVAEKDREEDHDAKGFAYDVDGNTWIINKGSIYKFDGKDFKEMYTCDRSLDTLNVYNEGSLIAWEDGQDVYTTVQEGQAESEKEVTPAQTGWVNTAAGWTFFDAAGKQVVGSWVNAGGVWYMMKADGVMATGWYNDNGTWYFLDTTSGAMKTGWVNANGTWYYMQSSGAMKTGWLNDNGTWYYLNANGSMAANTTVDGYNVAANGAWIR